jgi:hypothetical protein
MARKGAAESYVRGGNVVKGNGKGCLQLYGMSRPRRSIAGAGGKSKAATARARGRRAGSRGRVRCRRGVASRVVAISSRQAIRCSRARARLIGGGVDKRGQTNGPTWRGGGWNAGAERRRNRSRGGGAEAREGVARRGGCRGGVPPLVGQLYVAPPSRGQRGMVLVNDKAAWYDAVVDRSLQCVMLVHINDKGAR